MPHASSSPNTPAEPCRTTWTTTTTNEASKTNNPGKGCERLDAQQPHAVVSPLAHVFEVDGFNPDGETEGIGLINMRDRIGDVGGTLRIVSSPGRGTLVGASVPI